jgi:hypothetical protein
VPRLLPPGLALSAANARASLFGTIAGAVAAPIGILATTSLGQAWPLRVATVVFLYGMVTSLRLPPKADSEPPEAMPRALQRKGHKGAKVLSPPLIVASITGTAVLRAVYGFLALYLAFAIREGSLELELLGTPVKETAAIAMLAVALGAGTFLATGVGSVLHIRRPVLLQAVGIAAVAVAAGLAAFWFSLPWVALLCLVAALATGLAKLAVDAAVQERTGDRTRASAFAHTETLLMLAWVTGGALGLIPFAGRGGIAAVFVALALASGRAIWSAARLRKDLLTGTPEAPAVDDAPTTVTVPEPEVPALREPDPEPTTQALPHREPGRTKTLPMPLPRPVAVDTPLDEDDDDEDGDEPPGFHLYHPTSRP